MESEELLTGGNVAERVVRIGATVRKPATEATPSVEALLKHLEAAGFDASPRSLGLDPQGRHVLEYIPGQTCHPGPPLSLPELKHIGGLIRRLHDVSAHFRPPPSPHWNVAIAPDREELICHNDLAPWNLIRDENRWVFIDWDGAGPSSRLWDLAYAAVTFPPLEHGGDPENDILRIRGLLAGYKLEKHELQQMPILMERRARAGYDLLLEASRTGQQPWARLYEEGHGEYWQQTATYIECYIARWTEMLTA
jgi:Ser/Thr protein kinase RdoA (MazF antagonist)